jgi:hypothetical protein
MPEDFKIEVTELSTNKQHSLSQKNSGLSPSRAQREMMRDALNTQE